MHSEEDPTTCSQERSVNNYILHVCGIHNELFKMETQRSKRTLANNQTQCTGSLVQINLVCFKFELRCFLSHLKYTSLCWYQRASSNDLSVPVV